MALDAYVAAIENCKSSSDQETKKLSLYRAGWLSMKLQDNDRAEKFLSELAGIDFGFRDVATLLDKVTTNLDRDTAES